MLLNSRQIGYDDQNRVEVERDCLPNNRALLNKGIKELAWLIESVVGGALIEVCRMTRLWSYRCVEINDVYLAPLYLLYNFRVIHQRIETTNPTRIRNLVYLNLSRSSS